MEFEDLLRKVGGYGKYQKCLTIFFLMPISIVLCFIVLDGLFILSIPEHWCYVEDVANSNLSLSQQKSLVSAQSDKSCSMYDVNYTDYIDKDPTLLNGTAVIPCKSGWQYSKENYDSTASTKWNLVCDRRYYRSTILTLENSGGLLATPIYGYLADRYGRKKVFLLLAAVPFITGILSVLVENLIAFVVLRILHSSVMPAMFTVSFILVSELVDPEMRAHINGLAAVAWTIGLGLLALVAYLSRSWIILTVMCSLGCACNFLCCRCIPESPSWLLSRKRYDEASVIMYNIGKTNGKAQDKNYLLKELQALGEQKNTETGKSGSSFSLFMYPRIRKHFIVIAFCRIAFYVTYFGPIYNLSNLSGNEFFNFFLLSIVEVPGTILFWVLMDRTGRRWTAAIGYTVIGISCLGPLTGFQHSDIIFSLIGKLISSGLFMISEQQATELFPTVARSFGMNLGKTIASAATLLVPFFADLGAYGKELPFLVMAGISIVAGILTSFLPETLNENLPQTLADAEEFGKDQTFWSWKRKKIINTCNENATKELEIYTLSKEET